LIKSNYLHLENKEETIEVTGALPETEMNNSSVFDTEENLSLTKVAEILVNARTKCFTVCFNTKTDKDIIADQLSKVT